MFLCLTLCSQCPELTYSSCFQHSIVFKVQLRLCGCRPWAADQMAGWLTCFHERATSWAGAQGRYGRPARALCTRSRRQRDRSGRAQRWAGPQYSAANCTPPGIQAPGTRLYWGPTSLLQEAKRGFDCVFLKQTSSSFRFTCYTWNKCMFCFSKLKLKVILVILPVSVQSVILVWNKLKLNYSSTPSTENELTTIEIMK